jgi:acetyl esterase/lipase
MTEITVLTDVQYAEADGQPLLLDLYLPRSAASVPVTVYLHGGGWARGDKADFAAERLRVVASHGIAVASVNYRLVPHVTYPAPIHDAKGAVRWLRANAAAYGISPGSIAAWGASAGGYIATMLGLTADAAGLEGDTGGNLDYSSAVQAAVPWFAPSDLCRTAARSPLEERIMPARSELDLLGLRTLSEDPGRARQASPLSWVRPTAPPFLISHGDRDRMVPFGESAALHDALVRASAQSTLVVIGGAGHEDPLFDQPGHLAMTAAFLAAHLMPGH